MPFFKSLFKRIQGSCSSHKPDDAEKEKTGIRKTTTIESDTSTKTGTYNVSLAPSELSLSSELFDSQITEQDLSHFIVWYLYYDVVEMPRSPGQWYNELPLSQLQGWIQLGHDLGQSKMVLAKGLASTCHRMALNYTDVQDRLSRFSSWERMSQTETAEVGEHNIEGLNRIREILECDERLVKGLHLSNGGSWRGRQATIAARVSACLDLLVLPALAKESHRAERIRRTKTVDNFVRRRNIGIMWKALQKRRRVPTEPYRILERPETPNVEAQRSRSVVSSDETTHAIQCLMSRNALLESSTMRMRQEIERLKKARRQDSTAIYLPPGMPAAVTASKSMEDLSTLSSVTLAKKSSVPPLPRLHTSSTRSCAPLSRYTFSPDSCTSPSPRLVTPQSSGAPISFSMPFRNATSVTIRASTSTASASVSPTNPTAESSVDLKKANIGVTCVKRETGSLNDARARAPSPVLQDEETVTEIIDHYLFYEK